ncbi:fibrinogen and fibronectin [Daphnia sinensis]|uniref:Fibrinogen and fibronectin n=1 Tax=Daphnia sinensis TaxID=1820382 RepID=A0AAD5PNU5_9CRUS|nr:fibrinogen and fibronectin [Daphnia sinensis]
MLGMFVIVLATLLVDLSQAALLDPMTVMRDDISRIKVMMETVGERMERFNDLYLNKLETRLLSSATSLAHIDSNVKNLQERAHVWDTFQLHVSAWNEQIKSVDKKLDILSRGAEKWEILDEKMATLMPLDDRLTKLMIKLEETDARVAEIQRKINTPGANGGLSTSSVGEAPLFSEYTSRGVLSALKDIEIKVNKIATSDHSPGTNQERSVLISGRKEELELQKKTYDVVNDVAGKVDFILDKMSTTGKRQNGGKQQMAQSMDDNSEDVYDDGDSDYPSGSAAGDNGGAGPSTGINQAERAFVKQWRRMLQPVRRANQRFNSLDKVFGQLDKIANTSSMVVRRDAEIRQLKDDVAALLECCRGNDVGLRGLTRSVEALGEAVKAGQTDENQCVSEADLQTRLKHTQSELIRQMGDSFKEQMTSGVERIRQTCIGQRKKSLAIHNSSNGTNVISEEESTTEGAIASQGQATPVGPDAGKRDTMRNVSSSGAKMIPQSQPSVSAHIGQSEKIGVRGCHDLRLAGETETRVYSLASGKELNEGGRDYNTRFCDMTTDGGGWTVIQRRGDYGLPRENFSVNWRDYKLGFGQLDREFWFGNDFIHRLTNEHDVVLRVELWDFEDGHVYADYESFRVDSEEDLYRLWVEGYQGNATDSLGSHNGYAFSTFDRDNDEAPPCCPCAPAYGGGWWFYSCFEANLNGEYHLNPIENDYFRGIIWELWRGDYSLRAAELKIRPHDFPRMLPQVTTTTAATPFPPYLSADDIIPEDP